MKRTSPPFLFHELADLFGRGEIARASVLFKPEHALLRSAENEALVDLAIYAGNRTAVEFLWPHSDPKAMNSQSRTPLMNAIIYELHDLVPLLASRSDLSQHDEDGSDPLTLLFDHARVSTLKPEHALALLGSTHPDEPLPEGRKSPFLQAFYTQNWPLTDAFLPLMSPANALLHKGDLADKVSFYARQEAMELRAAMAAATPPRETDLDPESISSRAARRI